MAKSCAGCGYYDAAGTEDKCPGCDRALQTTFLPPPGANLGPQVKWGPPLATPQTARYSSYGPGGASGGIASLFRYRFLIGIVLAPILLCLKFALGFSSSSYSFDDAYNQIKPGMTTAQVEKLIADEIGGRPVKRAQRAVANGQTSVTYDYEGELITVQYQFGKVVSKSIADDEEP